MLFRIAIVFLLTGIGHLISIFTLKYISANVESNLLKDLAQVDSNLQLLLSIIASGLQSSAIINIATSKNWKLDYQNTQTARITLSLILFGISILAFKDKNYLIYAIAPLLALSGDYALYGKGFPIIGALNAFVRLFIPMISLIIGAYYFPNQLTTIYISSLFIVYLITNIFISYYLDVKLIFLPKISSIRLYFKTIPLGIIIVSLYFLGLGLILLAEFFYKDSDIAIIFIILKFYVIYKGVLRIALQSFIKEMIDDENCLKVDKLSIILGVTYFGSVAIFPNSFISLFFGSQFIKDAAAFQVVGIAALVYSIFLSMTTKAVLDKKEIQLVKIMLISNITTIILLISISYFYNHLISIAICLFIGELILCIGLAISFLKLENVKTRILFLFKTLGILSFCIISLKLFGDIQFVFITSIFVFGLLSIIINRTSFQTKKTVI